MNNHKPILIPPPQRKGLVAAVALLLRISVILVMVAQIFNRNFENVFLCVLTLVLFTVPAILERRLSNRAARYAGNHCPSVYLRGRDPG